MNKARILVVASIVLFALLALLLYLHSTRTIKTATGGAMNSEGTTLVVYCAAGVKPPMVDAAKKYEEKYGVRIQYQFGPTGTLLTNLQVAKTGDLYLAADVSYQEIAREKGLVHEIIPLAQMKPVIAVRKGNPKVITSLRDLLKPDVRLALGDEMASIGKQTRKLLAKAGIWKEVKAHVEASGVFKTTVNEVANDLKIGAVDATIVWDATVNLYPDLEALDLPELGSVDKDVSIGVLAFCKQPTHALRFARYLNSTETNAIFRKHGYRSVEGDVWAERPELVLFSGGVNRRAIEETVKAFGEREGVTVNAVFNGCGFLTAQMRTIRQEQAGVGFPDVYMACDRYYLDTVADWFQEEVDVSETQIMIAVQKNNPQKIKSLKDLAKPGMRVAVGQPQQCTIGVLSRKMLEKAGILEEVMKNVQAQTPSSAMLISTVTTNHVDACLAYRTDTLAEASKIDVVEVESEYAVRAIQPIAISKASVKKHLSRRLMNAILAAREKFEAAGFEYRLGRKEEQDK